MPEHDRGADNAAASDSIDERWVRERLNRLWPAHTLGFADLLIVLRARFDGDLDSLLIMLVIAIGSQAEDWEGALAPAHAAVLQRPTNTASIAQISGIPRESVRRKLEWLADRGWVRRSAAGQWYLAPAVADDLQPATRSTIDYFVRLFQAALKP